MKNEKYICPMHSEVISDKPGRCTKCGMKLVLESSLKQNNKQAFSEKTKIADYIPLIVILSLIALVSFIITFKNVGFSLSNSIEYFMIGFFIVFGSFKLMDLKGFAQGYSTYDLLAKRWFSYGYIYPFIELFFGIAMIINLAPKQILIAEIIVMTFSGIGVLIKILKREKFQCACLGTFLKVPLTKITLMEDFGMAALALLLLFLQ